MLKVSFVDSVLKIACEMYHSFAYANGAGGCGFDPQPGQYTRRVFHPARLPGKAFSVNMSLYSKF